MAKIVLNDLASTYDITLINDNFSKIESEFQNKVLYRNNPDGEPNTLQTDVDANGKRIYNLPKPTTSGEPLRLEDLENVAGNLEDAQAAANTAVAAAVSATASAASAASASSNASSSANAAAASELDAENAASSAAGSANTATVQATASSNSAAAALVSENAAAASAAAALVSENNAADSADDAAASASVAVDHINDPTGAHAASAISNTPAGNIAATTVQAAINELDSEKLSASATALPSSFASASINSITPAGGALDVNGIVEADSYKIGGEFVVRAQPVAGNYFLGRSGNLTNTGSGNTGVGDLALSALTTGVDHTAVGSGALQNITGAVGNTAVGRLALNVATTATNNTALGDSCLRQTTTGNLNVAVGYTTMDANTTGQYNTAVGAGPLRANTTGESNVAIGRSAMFLNTTSSLNTAVGDLALYFCNAGEETAVGALSLYQATARRNTAIGTYAGFAITSGESNTFIGYDCGNTSQTATVSRSIAIGNGAFTTADDQCVIGGSNITETKLRNVSVTGYVGINGGSYVAPSNGQAYLYASSGLGLVAYGQGSTADLTVLNGAGTEVMRVLTGTTNLLIGQTTNPNGYKLAVTGTLGVTGSISATATAETFISTAATTSPRSLHLANTGADVYFGIEGSSSGGFFTGSTAYATVVYSTQRVQTIIGGVKRTEVDSSGITVTGLTTTDTLRVNVTPTAETPTATHTAVFNINGTNYKFLCLPA